MKALVLFFMGLTVYIQAYELAVYWGQNAGGSQNRLKDYCDSETADILCLSFVNEMHPMKLNFANMCDTKFSDGTLHCPQIGEDVKYCQENGKKVFLSIGGQHGASFTSDEEAKDFAKTMWNKFGGGSDPQRPFNSAVVDGFDLDLESQDPTGTVAFGKAIREQFRKDTSRTYYLSAAPQCVYPDKSLKDFLLEVYIDYTFVQFYSNECNMNQQFNFEKWSTYVNSSSPNKKNKIFVGLPGSELSADSKSFASSETVLDSLKSIMSDPNFGGISVWDASSSFDGYAQILKEILKGMEGTLFNTELSIASTTSLASKISVAKTSSIAFTASNSHLTAASTTSTSSKKSLANWVVQSSVAWRLLMGLYVYWF
jgi:chitinase